MKRGQPDSPEEEVMAYANSKTALEEENKLLAILLTETMSYAKTLKPGSLGEFIVLDWAGSFDKLQKLNSESIADDEDSFRKIFADEVALLRGFLGVADSTGFGGSWAELFTKDIEIAERLLTKD
jgi:hypothetical protein